MNSTDPRLSQASSRNESLVSLGPSAALTPGGGRRGLPVRFLPTPPSVKLLTWVSGLQIARKGEPFEALIVTDASGMREFAELPRGGGTLTPLADLSGSGCVNADFSAEACDSRSLQAALDKLTLLAERVCELPAEVLSSNCDRLLLLARLATRRTSLEAVYAPYTKAAIAYPAAGPLPAPETIAESLCEDGLLKRRFFDRLHSCPDCSSHRLSVREECSKCRSPRLTETRIIHHFICAHQSLEDEFRDGRSLVCPKCDRELIHFGIDYDRPGSVLRCDACEHVSDTVAVGFRCLDCGGHSDGDVIGWVDWFHYDLTSAGEEAVRRACLPGDVRPRRAEERLAFAAMEKLLRDLSARTNRPHCRIDLRFEHALQLVRMDGRRTATLALELAEEVARQHLRAGDVLLVDGNQFRILSPESRPDEAECLARTIVERIDETVAPMLGPVFSVEQL